MALAFAFALVGCASAPALSGQELSETDVKSLATGLFDIDSVEQAAALEDGTVTAGEYREAFENLRACVEREGYGISDPQVNPVTNTNFEFVYDAKGRNQNTALEDYASCEEQFWNPVAYVYVSNAPQKIDEGLETAILSCMDQLGVKPAREPVEDFFDLAGTDPVEDEETRKAASECARQEVSRLYPDLISLTLGY